MVMGILECGPWLRSTASKIKGGIEERLIYLSWSYKKTTVSFLSLYIYMLLLECSYLAIVSLNLFLMCNRSASTV
jgi:hypothetical protein